MSAQGGECIECVEETSPELPTVDLTVNDGYDKRTKIVRELYTSEQIYVQNLTLMIEGYLEPLRKSQILAPKVLSGIFSNLEIVQRFHLHFLDSLSQRLSKWHDQQVLGEIFLSLAPYLKLYSQYCSNYDYSISLVQQSKKTSVEFAKFLSETQNDAKFKGSYISSYLILPIQRIPRYELFLKEINKVTSDEHPDSVNLKESLKRVALLAESVNESCEKAENIQKIIEISKAINMEKLLKPTRKYIREDDIELISEVYSGPSRCYLFNDLVIVTTKKSRKNYLSANLILCWLRPSMEGEGVMMISTNMQITLKFPTQSTREQWEGEFNKTLAVHTSNKDLGMRAMYSLVEDEGEWKVVKVFGSEGEHTEKKKKNRSLIESLKTTSKKLTLDKKKNDELISILDSALSSPKAEHTTRVDRSDSSPRSKSPREKREEHLKFMRRSHSISNNLKTRKDIDLFAPLPKLSENIVPVNHKSKEI